MRDHADRVDAAGLHVLGISFDSIEENRAFAEKFDFPFRLLCDVDRSVGMAYGAADAPEAGYAKRISYVIGEDGRILHAYPKVDPKPISTRCWATWPPAEEASLSSPVVICGRRGQGRYERDRLSCVPNPPILTESCSIIGCLREIQQLA